MNGCVAELERLLLTEKSQMRVTEPFRGNWTHAHCSNAGGVGHAPRILCHISILVTALEFCSTV